MEKGKYLRFVGYLEIIASIIGIIGGLIFMIGLSAEAKWALEIYSPGAAKAIGGINIFLSWVIFIFASFIAPSLGILFITVGDLWDEGPSTYNAPKITSYSAANPINPNEIEVFKDRLSRLEREIYNLKEEDEEPDEEPEDVINEEEQSKEKATKQNKIDVVKGKDKDSYELGDRVMINDDVVINGVKIKKGTTGIIDNRLMSAKGRTYVVILDKGKKSIEITGDYFE